MEDPVVLNYVRAGYVVVQLLAVAVYFYTSFTVCEYVSSRQASFLETYACVSAWGRLRRRTTLLC